MANGKVLLVLFQGLFALSQGYFFPLTQNAVLRYMWASSAVAGTWLYIDGGLMVTSKAQIGLPETLAVDLTQSWTNKTISSVTSSRPIASYGQCLWYDSFDNALYTFVSFIQTNNSPPPLWQMSFSSPNQASGSWKAVISQPSTFIGTGALYANTPKAFYSLGGVIGNFTASRLTVPANGTDRANPGLGVFDNHVRKWNETSLINYADGYGSFGRAEYIPTFGEQGVIIFLGGYTPKTEDYEWTNTTLGPLQTFSHIHVYDIASGQFYLQTATSATGTVPSPRWAFCTVVVEDSNSKGYDIFMYGGSGNVLNDGDHHQDYTSIWVLSIPSFLWSRIQGSSIEDMRFLNTCQVIGKRQMITIGGANPAETTKIPSADPFENTLAIFDMAALKWSSSYDPNAAPYERAKILATAVNQKPSPTVWDSSAVRDIFAPAKNNAGVIAGGVIGGLAGVALILSIIWLYFRRRRRLYKPQPTEENEENEQEDMEEMYTKRGPETLELPTDIGLVELEGSTSPELPGSSSFESELSPVSVVASPDLSR